MSEKKLKKQIAAFEDHERLKKELSGQLYTCTGGYRIWMLMGLGSTFSFEAYSPLTNPATGKP